MSLEEVVVPGDGIKAVTDRRRGSKKKSTNGIVMKNCENDKERRHTHHTI